MGFQDKIGFVTASFIFAGAISISAQIIENPAKPKAPNSGRVVEAKEILSISDENTGDYYFKFPLNPYVGSDGSFFIQSVKQVLQFDADGRFLRNLFKQGKGPGEMENSRSCLTTNKNIILHQSNPDKLLFFDHSGNYEREFLVSTDAGTLKTLLLFRDGMFYFQTRTFPRPTGNPDYVDVPNTIAAIADGGGKLKPLSSFTNRVWVASSGGMMAISQFISVPFQQKYIVLSHTSEYLLKIYDPAENKVVREFRRPYDRVKAVPSTKEQKEKSGFTLNDKHYNMPDQKYQNDIRNILVGGDEIWAVTSTIDETKGVLVDVFDGEGVYRDCFYLRLPKRALDRIASSYSCFLDNKALWVVEQTEEGTYFIKKYQVG